MYCMVFNNDMAWVSYAVLHNEKYNYTGISDIDTKIKSAVYRRDLEVIVYYTDKEKLPVKNVYCCTSFDSI